MKKIRSRGEFDDYLSGEFVWRLKEISDIRIAIKSIESTSQRAIIRAGITVLYAHWEGFVKASTEALLNYISNQRLNYRQLKPCFIVFGIKRQLNSLGVSGNSIENIAALEFLLNEIDNRATISFVGSINTESNLRSSAFERIARSVGIDTEPYESKYIFIDKELADQRNSIAHGNFLEIDSPTYETISGNVLTLLRMYSNDLSNIIQTRSYLA